MPFPVYDLLRFVTMASFGVGFGFMILTNIISFIVLRRSRSSKLRRLWWHVTMVSVAWILVGGVSAFVVFTRLGSPPGGLTTFVLPGMILFMIAQVFIFSTARERLAAKRALERAVIRSAEACE